MEIKGNLRSEETRRQGYEASKIRRTRKEEGQSAKGKGRDGDRNGRVMAERRTSIRLGTHGGIGLTLNSLEFTYIFHRNRRGGVLVESIGWFLPSGKR